MGNATGCGLVGYLGLRPAELATLKIEDEDVTRIGAIRRNANTKIKAVLPRVIAPIEVKIFLFIGPTLKR